MAPKSNTLIGGLAVVAALICALPAAKGIGAASKEYPTVQVNRSAKGDRLGAPRIMAVERVTPVQAPRQPASAPDQTGQRRIMDGCEPSFSSVTVPSMAHIAGRCIG